RAGNRRRLDDPRARTRGSARAFRTQPARRRAARRRLQPGCGIHDGGDPRPQADRRDGVARAAGALRPAHRSRRASKRARRATRARGTTRRGSDRAVSRGRGALMLDASSVGAYLRTRGVFDDAADVRATELVGGVSSVTLLAEADGRRVVTKQSLPKLRVQQEWLA